MDIRWKIKYRGAEYMFADAESAFRHFVTFYNRRDAKTAEIQKYHADTQEWETIKL